MKSILLSIVVASCFITLAKAAENASKYVQVEPIKPISIKYQDSWEVPIVINVEKGYHIQANPASAPNLIATTLTLTPNSNFEIGEAIYPKGDMQKVAGLTMMVSSYHDKVTLKVPIKLMANSKNKKYELTGKLKYQACNEKTCYFPMAIPIKIPVKVN
jgi:DsbC/DsbD-like thiol-disulfide interchange protein